TSEMGTRVQFAAEPIFVARRACGWEELVQVRPRLLPGFPVPRQRELRSAPLRFEPAAHKDVRAANDPDDRAGFSSLRDQLSALRLDARDRGGPLLPQVAGEIRPIFPEAVADGVGIPWLLSVVFHRPCMPPAPGDRLTRPQHHVHGGVLSAIAIAGGRPLEYVNGRLP